MNRAEYISDEQVVKRANAAVKIELDKNKALDIPITIYDRKTQGIYEVKPNGEKALICRQKKERYSERMRRFATNVAQEA